MFTLRVPVLQTGAFTITLPAVNYSSSGNNNRYPFFFPSSFCYNCLLLHFSDRVPVRSECYIIIFSFFGVSYETLIAPLSEVCEPVTGIEPVSTAWKSAMRSEFLTEFLSHLLRRFEVPFTTRTLGREVPVFIIRKLFPYESLPILCCNVLQQ